MKEEEQQRVHAATTEDGQDEEKAGDVPNEDQEEAKENAEAVAAKMDSEPAQPELKKLIDV